MARKKSKTLSVSSQRVSPEPTAPDPANSVHDDSLLAGDGNTYISDEFLVSDARVNEPQISWRCAKCKEGYYAWSPSCYACGVSGFIREYDNEPEPLEELGVESESEAGKPLVLSQIKRRTWTRISTGVRAYDYVLGGPQPGFVIGEIVIISGVAGCGKSTLLRQVACRHAGKGPAILASAEEEPAHIAQQMDRLGLAAPEDRMILMCTPDWSLVEREAKKRKASLVIADSLDRFYDPLCSSDPKPGSDAQKEYLVATSAKRLRRLGCSVMFVSHLNKKGEQKGSTGTEHDCDAVFAFSGDRSSATKLLTILKNRWGPPTSAAVFKHEPNGFVELWYGDGDPPEELEAPKEEEEYRALREEIQGVSSGDSFERKKK